MVVVLGRYMVWLGLVPFLCCTNGCGVKGDGGVGLSHRVLGIGILDLVVDGPWFISGWGWVVMIPLVWVRQTGGRGEGDVGTPLLVVVLRAVTKGYWRGDRYWWVFGVFYGLSGIIGGCTRFESSFDLLGSHGGGLGIAMRPCPHLSVGIVCV
ncbi:hypothetical protein G9A89_000692 [Geosiphon pyriformis]|nr:hypothetical protein G9A89_000692 [Geosiphon pyriformis]